MADMMELVIFNLMDNLEGSFLLFTVCFIQYKYVLFVTEEFPGIISLTSGQRENLSTVLFLLYCTELH